MAKTRQDLVNRALKNLGVLPDGQVAEAQDYNSVDALIDTTIEDLIARDVTFVDDVNAIEEKVFMPLGLILAWNCAAEFGQSDNAAIAALAQKAEKDLIQIQSEGPTFDILEVQAY